MSAEVDVPFVNPDAFTGGGGFLTPADVFSPTPSPFESFLQATGASSEQAAGVQDALSNFASSIKDFFAGVSTPSDVSFSSGPSDVIDSNLNPRTSGASTPTDLSSPTYNNALKQVAKGGIVIGGSALGVGAAVDYLSNSTKKVDQALGIPTGSSLVFLAVIAVLVLVVLLK